MKKRRLYLPLLILLLLTVHAHSQTQGVLGRRFIDNWSIGISAGPNIFFGDLKVYRLVPVSNNMNEWRAGGSVYLIRQLSHLFSLRGQLFYGEIAGTRRQYSDGAPCNQYFEGYMAEPSLNIMINFMNLFGYNPTRRFFLYGTIGVGMTYWHTRKYDLITHAQIGEAGQNFPDWTKEGSIPAGLGAYYNIGDKLNLGLEWSIKGINTDLLDATKGGFEYDMTSYLSVNVTYNFNKSNPATLKTPNAGKNMGPQPPRPDLPEAPKPEPKKENLVPRPEVARPVIIDTLPQRPLVQPSANAAASADSLSETQSGPIQNGLSFRVQIYAFRTDEYDPETIRERFSLTQPVYKEYTGGWYRYTVGSFTTLKAAQALQRQLKTEKGIKDAFVARYEDGVRISSATR